MPWNCAPKMVKNTLKKYPFSVLGCFHVLVLWVRIGVRPCFQSFGHTQEHAGHFMLYILYNKKKLKRKRLACVRAQGVVNGGEGSWGMQGLACLAKEFGFYPESGSHEGIFHEGVTD